MVLSVLSQVSNQLLEVEIARHLETKTEDSLYKCAQTLFSQFARVGFLLNGKRRIIASTVCVLCANKKIQLSPGANKILDIAEILFALHSLFYASALYGASFLVMRFVSHIADCDSNNPSAVKIKLVFVGYFSSLSKLLLVQGLDLAARVVNTLFLANIIADTKKEREIQPTLVPVSDSPTIQFNKLTDLPLETKYESLNQVTQHKIHSAIKNCWEANPMMHIMYHLQGGDEEPRLLNLKTAAYKVVSLETESSLQDPFIMGLTLRNKYNFVLGYLFTHFSYLPKVIGGIKVSEKQKHWMRVLVESPYTYYCHMQQRLENVLRAYFLDGDMSSIKESLIELCLALFCFNEVVQKKQEMSALTVEDLTKASEKSIEELTELGILV